MNFVMENDVSEILSKNDNPIVALIALDMRNIGLIKDDLNENIWMKFLVKEQLYDDHWLLAYEAVNKGWLIASEEILEEDPFFKILKDEDISFYNGANAEFSALIQASTTFNDQ